MLHIQLISHQSNISRLIRKFFYIQLINVKLYSEKVFGKRKKNEDEEEEEKMSRKRNIARINLALDRKSP